MNGKHFAIGILSVTAVILFTALIITNILLSNQAMAYAQSAAGGNYVVTTSQLNEYSELLVILNTASERMNVYVLNPQSGVIELIQPFDVKMFTREMQRRSRGFQDDRQPTEQQEDRRPTRRRKR